MPVIRLETLIDAEIQIVFDLARSIDLHQISTELTNEKAIAGTTSGLIGLNETVTWEARHFGVLQQLTSKITKFKSPEYFVDEMQKGIFKSIVHQHIFEDSKGKTLMIDLFDYESPLGILGKIADSLFLKQYMTRFLAKRNRVIKEFAETDKWHSVLM